MSKIDESDEKEPIFRTDFDPAYGEAIAVGPDILRVTASNPSAFTFKGTNSYVVGSDDQCFVIDPGPNDEAHCGALIAAIGERTVEGVILTHSHRDHAALAADFRQRVDAPLLGMTARPRGDDGGAGLDAAAETGLAFDRGLQDGEVLDLAGRRLEVVATPGHASDHIALALPEAGVLFSGDHVMAWSTPVVAPPDGMMRDYMSSLRKLLTRSEGRYLPGHGGPVERPIPFVRGLIRHRTMREAAIIKRIEAGDRTIPQIVAAIYQGLDPRLHGAAGLSVKAHLDDLEERGRIVCDADGALQDRLYRPAD